MQDHSEIYYVTIIGITLGLVLVGFIVITLVLYQKRQLRQENEMKRMKDVYENELLRSQLEIQENTFRLISQELHDHIGQMLSITRFTLSAIPVNDHPSQDHIVHAQTILNKAIYDLSTLTKSLHSDRIAQVGLTEAIRLEVDSLKRLKIFKVDFSTEGDEISLDGQKSIFLFRIFQESLNNIIKHAKASLIRIRLRYADSKLELQIIDDGIGFSIAAKTKGDAQTGVGLKSIDNRAKLIGAKLEIKSEPGKGTELNIKLPITSKN